MVGGRGVISVASNVAPRLVSDMQNAMLAGDFKKALIMQDRLMPLHHAMFVETSPGPVKYAVSLLGHCEAEARLPMIPVTDGTKKAVKAAMVHAGLLN